jgi:Cu+-exporting ATPase
METFNYEVYIKGMKCSSCSNKVERTMRDTEGVKSATVNLITEKMFISLKKEGWIKDIEKIIKDMGFVVTNINDLTRASKDTRVMKLYSESEMLAPNNYILSVKKLEGVLDASYNNNIISIEYKPLFINGVELYEKIKGVTTVDLLYKNEFVSNIEGINQRTPMIGVFKLGLLLVLTGILISLTMLLPKEIIKMLNSRYIFSRISIYLFVIFFLSAVIVIVFGLEIYSKTIRIFIRKRMVNMETLITLGSISAILLCLLNLSRLYITEDMIDNYSLMTAHAAEASATVIAILIFGKYVEDRARNNIKSHTSKIFSDKKLEKGSSMKKVKPGSKNFSWLLAETETDSGLLEKDEFCELRKDDFLFVDCVIVSGTVGVNENSSYGSLDIVEKGKGDKLKSGTEIIQIRSEKCFVMIEEVLEHSLIYKVTQEMSNSLNQKMKFQKLIDRVVRYFVPIVVTLSLIISVIWLCLKYIRKMDVDLSFIFERSISIMVISCPCAFGLAIPTVTTIALNKALKYGILIKNLDILPEIRKSNIFVFDKTGTLTEIVKEVNIEYRSPESQQYPIFEILAQIEKAQKHPIAEAIYSLCIRSLDGEHLRHHVEILNVQSNGIVASYNNENILVGNNKLLEGNQVSISGRSHEIYEKLKAKNLTTVFVVNDSRIELILSIDTTSEQRKEAQGVIHLLQGRKIILSGDNEESVKELGKHLGIKGEDCFGQVDSQTKKEILQNLRKKGKVLMIGDGINDILSLSEADFGISFNSTSHLNLVASDIIFVKQDLSLILSLIRLSKITYIFILMNIFWAFSYNLMMLPIAAGVFHSIDFDMTPTSSSFSMLCSSMLIILTSNLLRLFKLDNFKEDLWIRNTIITVKTTTATEMDISDIDIHNKKKIMLTKRKEGYIELV